MLSLPTWAQTPRPDPSEKIATEEIRVNVNATNRNEKDLVGLKKEDLVILEDGRLHQASSVRALPASVLIAMDTGGSMRHKKNIDTTRSVASAVAAGLLDGTSFAVLHFHDRVERLSGWTADKREALDVIEKKTGFGRRSTFTQAITEAEEILAKAPSENRHIVLITDGLDSTEDESGRGDAIRKLWQSGVVVHVISYTAMEFKAQKPFGSRIREGEPNPRRIPEEVMEQLAHALPVRQIEAREILKRIYQPRLLIFIIDMPYLRAQRNQTKALATAQLQLGVLAEYTGGEFILPDTLEEMVRQAETVSRSINSQFVVTYEPKRPLREVKGDEIRQIEVSSRRPGLDVRASRRLVVFGGRETETAPKIPN